MNDRDLKLFDAMLRDLRWKFRIDDSRIYAAGFSNGGFFDYILWSRRPQVFAAFAPCAAALRPPLQISIPKPVFVVAGEQDQRVPFEEQRKNVETLRKLNGCTEKAIPGKQERSGYHPVRRDHPSSPTSIRTATPSAAPPPN